MAKENENNDGLKSPTMAEFQEMLTRNNVSKPTRTSWKRDAGFLVTGLCVGAGTVYLVSKLRES